MEDHREELRVQLAHVTKGDSSRDADAFIPLHVRLLVCLLKFDVWLVHFHHEDTKNSLDCFLVCESVAS